MSQKAKRDEDAIQRAVFKHIAARGARGLVAFAVPNGGKRSRVEAAIMKGLGVKRGVSDIIAFHKGKFFALELKAHGGTPTVEQLEFIADVNAAGGYAMWVTGLDRALAVLESWGLLRGKKQ